MAFNLLEALSILVLMGAIVSLGLAAFSWHGSKRSIVRPFAAFQAMVFLWSFFGYLRFHIPVYAEQFLYHRLEYLGILFTPLAGLAFVASLGSRPLGRRTLLLLGAFPAFAFCLVWLSASTSLFLRPSQTPWGSLHVELGPFFWINAAYAYCLVALGFASLLFTIRRSKGAARRLYRYILALFLIPVVINLGWLASLSAGRSPLPVSSASTPGLPPPPGAHGLPGLPLPPLVLSLAEAQPKGPPLDPTPMAFAIFGVFVAIAMRRFSIFDSMPFAKEAIFSAIRDPILSMDREGTIIGSNQAARDLLKDRPSLEGSLLSDFCPGAGPFLDFGGACDWSYAGRSWTVVVHPLDDDGRSWSGSIVFFYDVTERLEALKTLADREEALRRYSFMVNASRDIMTILGKDFRYEAVNDAFCEHYRKERTAILGRTIDEVWAEEGLSFSTRPGFEDCLQGRQVTQAVSHDFRDGRGVRDLELTFNPYRSAQGKVTHAVLVTKDVTDYLETHRQLAKAREEAIEASSQKGAFLAAMSHEIRTPLNAVIGLTELTLKSPLSAEQRDNLETVLSSAHSLLDLINDILDLSKIEAGRMSLESIDFDLPARVALVLKTFRPSAEAKGLYLDLVVDEGAPRYVLGDPLRLGQLVTNLVGNAIKFTETGGVKVRITPWETASRQAGEGDSEVLAAVGDGGGGGILVAVSDTGVGIAPEKQGLIFESFSQADTSVSRRYGGTGLGLSICRQLAGLFGGSIWVESEPGQGATFYFTARLGRGDPSRIAHAPARVSPGLGSRPLRILVVEDNPVNAKVAQRWLTQEGHSVLWASSGLEALTRLAEATFDLMILDVEMPDMDGLEVARRVRKGGEAGPSGPALPIVAMTAHSGAEAREACTAAGMDDYVAKPVDFVELAATLSRVARPSTREFPQPPAPAFPQGGTRPGLVNSQEPLRRLGGDTDLYWEILSIFAAEAPGRIISITDALARGDREEMRALAHSLRGSARTVGADRLAESASRLEAVSGPSLLSPVSPERRLRAGEHGPEAPGILDKDFEALVTATVDLLQRSAQEAQGLLPPGYVAPIDA